VPAHKDKDFLQIAQRLFNTEAETLEKLGDMTNSPVASLLLKKIEFYLVQEFIQGHSLRDELLGADSEAQVVALLKDILKLLTSSTVMALFTEISSLVTLLGGNGMDGLVLIDFGAVKQLHKSLMSQKVILALVSGLLLLSSLWVNQHLAVTFTLLA